MHKINQCECSWRKSSSNYHKPAAPQSDFIVPDQLLFVSLSLLKIFKVICVLDNILCTSVRQSIYCIQFSSVQSLSRVRFFVTHESQHARPP